MECRDQQKESAKPTTKAIYNPEKFYTWDRSATFQLSGEEFGAILNSLRGILATKEAQNILRAARANDVIEKLMANAVENGVAKEDTSRGLPEIPNLK